MTALSSPLTRTLDFSQDQGKLDEAVAPIERAIAIYEKSLGPDHPHVATGLNNLARLLHGQGKSKDALALMERVLRIRLAVYGPSHPDTQDAEGAVGFLSSQ